MSDNGKPAMRTERDSLGDIEVPADALYGVQTQRGNNNFPITGWRPHPMLVAATVMVKKAAAITNGKLGQLDAERVNAIVQAADEVLGGQHLDHWRIDPFQAGAGTSHNMNTNEVLANRANEILGQPRGSYKPINPNDHVNMAQSTNDVFPTSMRLAVLMDLETFYPALEGMAEAYAEKGREFDHIIKSGRTHMQDAVPIRLGQEFTAYSRVLFKMRDRIKRAAESLLELNIGATAAGTGLNSDPRYQQTMVATLRELTGFPFQPAEHLVEMTQSQYAMADVSAALRGLALELIRISHDMRFMSSGPQTGIMEIVLPPVQPGSSIMPGKVNPVMFEMLTMVCNQVVGNDTAVALGVSEGQLELNVMMPQLAFSTMFSVDILKNAMRVVTEYNVRGITANEERARYMVEHSMGLATALNPYIGYAAAATVVKEALKSGKPIRQIVIEQGLLPADEVDRILDPRTMTEPGIPGKGAMPVGGGG
jgi:aspartate ammonia-lyase